jgi:hypothetical protein
MFRRNSNTVTEASSNRGSWRRLSVCLLLSVIVLFVALFVGVFSTLESFSESVMGLRPKSFDLASRGLERVVSIPERFKQGTITKTFIAAIPEISTEDGGLLELATARSVETFEIREDKRIAWNLVPLGITESRIRVPVTYRYHIKLADDWLLNTSGSTCVVFAPPLRPSQPPAIHTDEMVKESRSGWARFNKEEQMDALLKSLTPQLRQFASDSRRVSLVREDCRKGVADFVKSWLLREQHWGEGKLESVKVLFPDEVADLSLASELASTSAP